MAILLILHFHMDAEGECFPSQITIAREARTTPETVNRILKRIVESGWLERSRGRGGQPRSYRYRAAVPAAIRVLAWAEILDWKSIRTAMGLIYDQVEGDSRPSGSLTPGHPNTPMNGPGSDQDVHDVGSTAGNGKPPHRHPSPTLCRQLAETLSFEDSAFVLRSIGEPKGPVSGFHLMRLDGPELRALCEKYGLSEV